MKRMSPRTKLRGGQQADVGLGGRMTGLNRLVCKPTGPVRRVGSKITSGHGAEGEGDIRRAGKDA
jgi:hypothetical protein